MAACVAKAAVHLGEAGSCNQASLEVDVKWFVLHAGIVQRQTLARSALTPGQNALERRARVVSA